MARKCPICKSPVEDGAKHRPFCSARCKDIDLGTWFNEEYRIQRPLSPLEAEQVMDEMGVGEDDPSMLH